MPEQLRPVEVQLPAWGVFVLESQHSAGFRMGPSVHAFWEFFYVLRGQGGFTIDGVRYPCAAGEVVVVPAGAVHQIADEPSAPLALYGLCVAPQVWQCEPSLAERLPTGRLMLSSLASPQIRTDLRRLLYEQTLTRPGGPATIVGLALQLLGTLAHGAPAGTGPTSARSRDSTAAVARYFADLPQQFLAARDLDATAAELNLSRRRFTQLFRAVAGQSWADYLTQLRIRHACHLLHTTNRSIIAVAFECGYEDLSGFYRAFNRLTGQPPAQWRKES